MQPTVFIPWVDFLGGGVRHVYLIGIILIVQDCKIIRLVRLLCEAREVKDIDLKTIIDLNLLQNIQDNLAEAVGIGSMAVGKEGPLTRPSNFSTFCRDFIRSNPKGLQRCNACDLKGGREAAQTGKPSIYYCHAGLVDFAAPIFIDGKHVGAILGGQVLPNMPNERDAKEYALEMGANPEQYLRALREIPVISESRIRATAELFYIFSNAISEISYQKMRTLENARQFENIAYKLKNIFNTLSDGVIVVDAQGVVNELNPVAKKIIGKSDKEVLGANVEKVFGSKEPFVTRMLNCRRSYADMELMIETKQGLIHCLASGEPITDDHGRAVGGVIVLRPIDKVQKLVNRFSSYYTTFQFSDIIGNSSEILEAIRVASLAANTNSNIVLQGESGTGKEMFAQAIHNRSPRQRGAFIAINCGAIPRELIGSELFGYADGAFTGAKKGGKPGKFELADGGTLFLDEIGDMPMEQQVALLRVLQDKKVARIGSDKEISVDVRVICATNKNLLKEVEKGVFRQDLYYRLNVISIVIPPLRNRTSDVILLFQHFLEQVGRERGRSFWIEKEVLECITRYSWPGNVRELRNVVERIASFIEGAKVTIDQLPEEIRNTPSRRIDSDSCYDQVLRQKKDRYMIRQMAGQAERDSIIRALEEHGGNISMTAQKLGIARSTLYRKMHKHGIV